jgi:hypothetical protein
MKLNEVYKDSGLGKWFHKQSATKEPGWDRYNSAGKRVGKCGDAEEGESYSACLSKQKAKKLGKDGIGSFVKRKREAQSDAGRGKKGTGSKGKKPIFVETGAAKKKVNESMKNNNEDCGCEHDKKSSLMNKIKQKISKKLLKEQANFKVWKKDVSNTSVIKECMDFTELDLVPFRGKKTLVETNNGNYYGVLGIFKNNFALFEDGEMSKIIDPTEVTKVVCEDTRVVILEKNKPNDPEKWSDCKSQAKSKFDVYPSAYANAWASKCYKKKGGSWRTVKEEIDLNAELLNEVIKQRGDNWVVMNKAETKVLGTHPSKTKALAQLRAIEASKARHGMHENVNLILQERLKDRFFNQISEDIVNKDNKGKLTPQASNPRAKSRDNIREKVKGKAKVVTGPKDKNGNKIRDDTPEEASYRLATYIELMKKGKKSKKSEK